VSKRSVRIVDLFEDVGPEVTAAFGRVTLAWSRLDYMLRIATKRLLRQSVLDADVMSETSHNKMLEKFQSALNETQDADPRLHKVNETVGTSGCGLYDKRNKINHAICFRPAGGALESQRVGKPAQSGVVSVSEMDDLVADLDRISVLLQEATLPPDSPDEIKAGVSVA